MSLKKIGIAAYLGLGLAACGGGSSIDDTAILAESCNTQQGIGWLKREYGEGYCDCWVAQAKEVLSAENYRTFVKVNEQELNAADAADRERLARQHTELYSTVSSAAKSCTKAG